MLLFHKDKHIAKNTIVSLDFDSVLSHGINTKKKKKKKWFGMNLSLSQTKKKGFESLAKQMNKKINYRSLMDPLNEKHIMEYEVPPHCISTLKKLHKEGFRFVIITSRNNHDYPYAVTFVKHNFGNIIKFIHNTRNQPKNEFVRKVRPRIHIDDDLKKLQELIPEPISLAYYRQPENEHENVPKGHTRIKEIHNWEEFYHFCHDIKLLHEAVCWKYDVVNNYRRNTHIFRLLNSISEQNKQKLIKEYISTKNKKLLNTNISTKL